jgi:MYXO-CTERM domain-containing protein
MPRLLRSAAHRRPASSEPLERRQAEAHGTRPAGSRRRGLGWLVLGAGLVLTGGACAAEADEAPSEESAEHEAEPTGEISNALVGYDCGTHTDTGYTNGKAFQITVVTVDGKPVEIATANAFLTMAKAAEANGINLRINSGFRTNAEQQYLYNCYLNKNCNNGNLAAKPGYSNHQSGHALDINTSGGALDWLNAHGAAHGFKRTVPSESWHWEWWGGGSPQTFCGNQTPQGYLDAAGCDVVKGWAFDAEAGAAAIPVHVYFGGPAGGAGILGAVPINADVPRDDLCKVVGSCNHGFEMLSPLSLFDGAPHPVYAYGINTPAGDNPALGNSPRELKCAATLPAGVARWVPNPTVLGNWKYDYFLDLLPVDAKKVDAIPREKDVGEAPVLARAADGSAVYLLDRGEKRHVPSPAVMTAWRFDWGKIQVKPNAEIDALPEGKPVRARPTLVRDSAGRVLLIDDAGPVPPPKPGTGGAGGAAGSAGAPGAGGKAGGASEAGGGGDGGGEQTGVGGSSTDGVGAGGDDATNGGQAGSPSAGNAGSAAGGGLAAGAPGRGTGTDVAFADDSEADGACGIGRAVSTGERPSSRTGFASAFGVAVFGLALGRRRRRS